MSIAWETTPEDVTIVLDAHKINYTDAQLERWCDEVIDYDAIEEGLLHYCSVEAQTNSMLDDIENQLMEAGIIPKGDKLFVMTQEDEDSYDDSEGDFDEDDD